MNLRRELKTDRRLWLLFGVVAFALLGSVRLFEPGVEGKVGRSDFWRLTERAFKYLHTSDGYGALMAVMMLGAFLVFLSAIVGWAGQAIVVTLRGSSPSDRDETARQAENASDP